MEDCRKGYGRSNFCVGDCSENTVRFTNNKTLLHYSNLIHVFNTRRRVQTACVNRRRASNKRRASNTGRGSEPFVPIDAPGASIRGNTTWFSCQTAGGLGPGVRIPVKKKKFVCVYLPSLSYKCFVAVYWVSVCSLLLIMISSIIIAQRRSTVDR